MEIRPFSAEEMGQARVLWETCFQDHPTFLDWYFQTRFQPRDGLGIFLDSRLLSAVHLSPRKIKLRNRVYSSAYLLALATTPSFRHLGLARTLLTYALRHLAANQIFFTFLLPFNIEFYTRLGWGAWADHRLFVLPATSIKANNQFRLPPALEERYQFEQAKPDPQPLAGIYQHYLATWDGGLVREKEDWTCLLLDHTLDGGQIWLGTPQVGTGTYQTSKPQVYALVLPTSPLGRPLLRELAWIDQSLLPGTVFGGTDGKVYHLTPYHLPETQPVYLGRITSVRSALEALTYPPLTAQWTMAVADPLLPENNGLYQLKLTNGQPKVTLKNGGKPDLSCSVGALAGLLTGQARPQALIESGALTVYGKNLGALLDTVFPPTRNFVNEYF